MTKQEATPHGRVLVVDDDPDMLNLLSTWLGGADYDVAVAGSGEEALARIDVAKPDLVITDLFMDGMDGMALLAEIHSRNPLIPVVMLSGQAQIPDAVRATHLGTAEFLTKPIDKDELVRAVGRHARRDRASDGHGRFGRGVIYRSALMGDLLEQAEMLADGDITVFINGETGTGKEVLAKAIHAAVPKWAKLVSAKWLYGVAHERQCSGLSPVLQPRACTGRILLQVSEPNYEGHRNELGRSRVELQMF